MNKSNTIQLAFALLLVAGSHADATGVCLSPTKVTIFRWPSIFSEKKTSLVMPAIGVIRPDTVLDIRIERTSEGNEAWASISKIRSPGVPADLSNKILHLELGECFVVPAVGAEGTVRGTLLDENTKKPGFRPATN